MSHQAEEMEEDFEEIKNDEITEEVEISDENIEPMNQSNVNSNSTNRKRSLDSNSQILPQFKTQRPISAYTLATRQRRPYFAILRAMSALSTMKSIDGLFWTTLLKFISINKLSNEKYDFLRFLKNNYKRPRITSVCALSIEHMMNACDDPNEECFGYILNKLQEEMVRCALLPFQHSRDNTRFDEQEMNNITTALHSIVPPAYEFESIISTTMKCTTCQYVHPVRHEKYREILLDISTNDLVVENGPQTSISVVELIRKYLRSEHRELQCPHCAEGNKVEVHKSMSVLPPVLTLHLKRFSQCTDTGTWTKNSRPVTVPTNLDLHQCGLISSDDTQSYSLQKQLCKVSTLKSRYEAINENSAFKLNSLGAIGDYASSIQSLHLDAELTYENEEQLLKLPQDTSLDELLYSYKLKTIVKHFGCSVENGQYTYDAFDSKFQKENNFAGDSHEGGWMCYDDSVVNSIREVSFINS